MTVLRMDNIGIVVEDLEAAIAFFVELGLELEGETTVEGPWVDQCVGLTDVRCDIAMLRAADGQTRIELTRFHRPAAIPGDLDAPANVVGLRRIMFAVDDIDDTIARLRPLGGEVLDTVAQFENAYRLCYLRGPEGLLIALAQPLADGV